LKSIYSPTFGSEVSLLLGSTPDGVPSLQDSKTLP